MKADIRVADCDTVEPIQRGSMRCSLEFTLLRRGRLKGLNVEGNFRRDLVLSYFEVMADKEAGGPVDFIRRQRESLYSDDGGRETIE